MERMNDQKRNEWPKKKPRGGAFFVCGGGLKRKPPEREGLMRVLDFREYPLVRELHEQTLQRSAPYGTRTNLFRGKEINLVYLLSRVSGKRDSNPRPSAWEADALPTELLPQKRGDGYCPMSRYRDSNPGPTHYECVALPTEPYRQPHGTLGRMRCKGNILKSETKKVGLKISAL